MSILQSDYEKLGAFYLGREYDMDSRALGDDLVMYDSKDLVTHGVVLGMTGSGKTGLCITLLEEAAMDNIPAIVIDPKGDIANLMLTFPGFAASDFRPWINEDEAAKNGLSGDEHAAKTARMWEKGLGDWGQGSDRVKAFRDHVDVNIFTPGSKAGIPVSILSSLEVPPFEVMDDGELFGDRIESTVSSLLSLIGIDTDAIQSEEAVLLSAIFQHCWTADQSLTMETLIRFIQKPPFDKVGVIDLESFYPAKNRQDLALKFNNLIASPSFSTWMEGPSLDIQKMLYQDNGKARISIFSIAHLSDAERMFFVSILLNQMLGWMRCQSGTTSLRAMLYMDEIFGYLPPTANPPSKKPLMTMLKQGRAFGLGVLLATQNPVDLDYKALSNIGTWWLGRLQTERDKARVLDGLEGAAGSQNGSFNRQEIEQLLSGLDNRVFLMNNVHEDGPVVFHVRWVMSYLPGPLTRRQIKILMDPKRDAWETNSAQHVKAQPGANPMSMPGSQGDVMAGKAHPVVGEGVQEFFVPAVAAEGVYQPHLLRQATVHYQNTKTQTEGSRMIRFVNPILSDGIAWDDNRECHVTLAHFLKEPNDGIGFGELPGYAMNRKNYDSVTDEFTDWIFRNDRLELWYAPVVDVYSKFGESEGEFRARLGQSAREKRDEAVEKMRETVLSKIKTREGQLDRALAAIEREQSQARSAKMNAGVSILGTIMGVLLGKRKMSVTNMRRGSGSISSAGRAMQQSKDVEIAEAKAEDLRAEIEEMQNELDAEVRKLEDRYDPSAFLLEKEVVKPYKKDIEINAIGLLWIMSDR